MAAAVIEEPNGVEFWIQSLDCINTILKVEAHVVVHPIPLFTITITMIKEE
jgi:hypothetical protein